MRRHLIATLSIAMGALAGCDRESPRLTPPEPSEETKELDRNDFASEREYLGALRDEAFRVMDRMPPEQLRVFMMENRTAFGTFTRGCCLGSIA